MVQVAVPETSVVLEPSEQLVAPAVPPTLQTTLPVGVAPDPATVAVKVTVLPRAVGVELPTTLVGVRADAGPAVPASVAWAGSASFDDAVTVADTAPLTPAPTEAGRDTSGRWVPAEMVGDPG